MTPLGTMSRLFVLALIDAKEGLTEADLGRRVSRSRFTLDLGLNRELSLPQFVRILGDEGIVTLEAGGGLRVTPLGKTVLERLPAQVSTVSEYVQKAAG